MNLPRMKFLVYACAISLTICGSLLADDWDPNDDTFDPTIKSVVIGERSWIGDPSPFKHVGLSRTGYTHVNATNFKGFPPSVQISLMVPLVAGETQPPAGGMLMFDQELTRKFVVVFEDAIKASLKASEDKSSSDKVQSTQPVSIKTSLKDANWVLDVVNDKDQHFLQLTLKNSNKADSYRFSINASKKLLGAVRHSLKSLESDAKK